MSTAGWPVGLMTALLTPLKDDALDVAALPRLLDRQIASGVSGLVVGGGTGEFGVLAIAERRRLSEEVIGHVAGRLPVVIQTGTLATRDALELSQHAQELGAFGLLVASPFGEPISWRERLHFYEQVNGSVDLPILIYNTPPSGNLRLDQVAVLADLSNISGVKDSSGSAEQMGDLLAWAVGTDFAVYVGMDSLMEYAIPAGARGAVLGAASFLPEEMARMIALLRDGTSDGLTRTLWRELRSMLRFLEASANYVALCKVGSALDGIDLGDVRAPFLMPAQDERDELVARMRSLREVFATATAGA